MKRAAQTALALALTIAPLAVAGQAQAAARPMASCGSEVANTPIYFSGYSQQVASLKLTSGGCSYLWMWSWFTASHSGWTVGLTTCPSRLRPPGYPVYPISDGNGAVAEGCARPYVWTNTSQQEFYGPAAGVLSTCEHATLQIFYNSEKQRDDGTDICFA
ncbi:hypothetical protein [Kutzneria sp. 744]|uniref:hypothetical protein n=2 Tax=unclassified Kutzneria TaxID=2621979 RepID=UPI0003EECEDD|nr:hypothetical protein [Kutzneria sp. 744]EWM18875.1 hypothetical protein KUTG_09179 [Kutzneria sp. 744]